MQNTSLSGFNHFTLTVMDNMAISNKFLCNGYVTFRHYESHNVLCVSFISQHFCVTKEPLQ